MYFVKMRKTSEKQKKKNTQTERSTNYAYRIDTCVQYTCSEVEVGNYNA